MNIVALQQDVYKGHDFKNKEKSNVPMPFVPGGHQTEHFKLVSQGRKSNGKQRCHFTAELTKLCGVSLQESIVPDEAGNVKIQLLFLVLWWDLTIHL